MSSLRSKASYIAYTALEHVSNRGLDALLTLVLIRYMNVESFGVFTVFQSWVGLFLFMLPNLENILYRDYARTKKEGTLGRRVALFRAFNWFKISLAALFALGAAAVAGFELSYRAKLAAVTLALVLPLSQSLYGIYRETLRFELHMKAVMILNGLQKSAFLAVAFAACLWGGGSVEAVAPGLLATAFLFAGLWYGLLRHCVPAIKDKSATAGAAPTVMGILKDAVIWMHINGTITAAIQTLDVYFLSRSGTPLAEIALYSVALKAANFFQILPMPFAQLFTVYLGRKVQGEGEAGKRRMVWVFSLGLLAMVVAMMALGMAVAEPLLAFLARGKFSAEELARGAAYFRYMLAGVCIYILCFPAAAYLNYRSNLKVLMGAVFLPWFAFSLVVYRWNAAISPLAAARANMWVYGFCTLGIFILYAAMSRRWRRP